jgi:hypothetical protein
MARIFRATRRSDTAAGFGASAPAGSFRHLVALWGSGPTCGDRAVFAPLDPRRQACVEIVVRSHPGVVSCPRVIVVARGARTARAALGAIAAALDRLLTTVSIVLIAVDETFVTASEHTKADHALRGRVAHAAVGRSALVDDAVAVVIRRVALLFDQHTRAWVTAVDTTDITAWRCIDQ